MADSNMVKLEWRQFPNNKIVTDGFYAEYQAKDKDFDRTKSEPGAGDITTTAENTFYEKNSKTIILKPDIMPVDMIGELQEGKVQGDWWDLYDSTLNNALVYSGYADFQLRNIAGDPKRQLVYQKVTQYKAQQNLPYSAVRWMIRAGYGCGYIQNEQLAENQGIVFWVNENMLPENEKNELNFYLYHTNPENSQQVINGIYITLKEDSDIRIGHFIDLRDDGRRPPQFEVATQWEKGTVSAAKEIVEWPGKTRVFVLMMIDKYILFGINGLENPFVMECQNYETGISAEGLPYPVILRENAILQVHGMGQALFGLKKLAYSKEATFKTPEFKTGYVLSAPRQITRIKRDESAEVERKWQKQGSAAADYKVYAEIKLEGSPMGVDEEAVDEPALRVNEYRKEHTEKTPVFIKTKIFDNQQRDTEVIELPDDIEGTIVSYVETASANENGVINDYSLKLDCYGSFDNMYADILAKKQLHAEVYIKLRGQETTVSMGGFVFRQPMVKINNFENIALSFSAGQETAIHSLKKSAGYIISFDDRRITDIAAMQEICNINNLSFETDVTGAILPETVEGQEGAFTFQPNVSFLEILTKLADVQGYNFFTDEGIVCYKKEKAGTDMTLGRSSVASCEGIEYEQNDLWKSRIYVIGKAGENTAEYKRGEKLVGIWQSKAIEKEIGYDVFTKENESLTDWDMIEKEGAKLWRRFNGHPYAIKFNIEDAIAFFDKIKLFNTFTWQDNAYSFLNNKRFEIRGYTKEVDMSDCKATITGVML
ncbi:MAG: hypothetical protein PHW65_00930 [Dehalococcoidales bacterium]|nr:hypothetical protein [Dehalococcoidales bacterium]